jgi:hypothetical protein
MKPQITSLHNHFGRAAATVDTPEQLGVLLIKAILRSALEYKITSEDGKSLVVPILISLRPVRRDQHIESGGSPTSANAILVLDCHGECWYVLGHQVYCRTVCFESGHKMLAPPVNDESLLAQIKPGPPLLNPELVEPGLQAAILSAATSAEFGVLASNAVASAVRAQPDLIRDDGSVEITARATVSLLERATEVDFDCKRVCFSILGHDIVCHETCITHVQ